jgi:hypothetical protein
MAMNRIGRLEDGQKFTTGEKAFVVMLMAGVFGYWAGFNLSTPSETVAMPLAAAAALPASTQASRNDSTASAAPKLDQRYMPANAAQAGSRAQAQNPAF